MLVAAERVEKGGGGGGGRMGFVKGFVESLALSSANASQNALWVMKLSFLHAQSIFDVEIPK